MHVTLLFYAFRKNIFLGILHIKNIRVIQYILSSSKTSCAKIDAAPKQTLCQNRCCVKMTCTKTLAPKHNVLMFFYIIDILLWSRVEQLTVSLHFPIWYENDIFRVSVNQRLDPDPAVHPLEELLYRLALHPRKWPDLFSGAHYLNFCLLWSPIFPLASRGDIVVPLTHTVNE